MKRIITLALALLMLLSSSVLVLADDAPLSSDRALLESLKKGIIPITPDTTYEDFMSLMQIVDESDEKFYTAKFETFVAIIEYYHYNNMTVNEIFAKFAAQVDSVDINNMDEAYTVLFSMLDRFSYYLPTEKAESFFKPTAAKGVGIKMLWKDAEGELPAGIYVEEVANGSPAEKAGVQVGDRIVEFNGNNIRGLGFEALATYNSLVEEDAETIDISFVRGDEVLSYTIERTENIFDEYAITLYPEKNLVYLDINSFMNSSTATDIAYEIDTVWQKGYRNIIIDLRDNSGGDVNIAAYILSKFSPEREALFSMGRDGRTDTIPFISLGNGYKFDRVSVLVNHATASSAEVFADTLRNTTGAKIIGTKTFGKGVAQAVFTFGDGAACGVTSYVAYDRYGKTYNEIGINPDSISYGKIEKNELPSKTPSFTVLNFHKAVEGAENAVVRGLEIRLEAIGFLSQAEVDGVWSDATTRAISALQTSNGIEATGDLDKATYLTIMQLVKDFENTYYYSYTPFDYAYRFMPYSK